MCDFESLFNLYPTPSWVYSVETLQFLAVNEAAIRVYGYTREQFLQMNIEEIRPPQDLERLRQHIREGGCSTLRTSIWRHKRRDGSCIDVEIESNPIEFRGESARIVSARNVTSPLNNLERLNLALSAGKFAVWEYDLSDGSLIWDPTESGVYGIDRGHFPKTKAEFLTLVEPEFRDGLEEAFRQCAENGSLYDIEFRLHMPGIGMRWRHAIGKRIHDAAGNPIKIIGIGIDITERKRLEEQVYRSQKLEAVGRLASGIAHDFNNILTVISGYAHLLRGGQDTGFATEAGKEICTAADRAARLVKQLLDFSRSVPLDPKPVELNQLVDKALVLISRLLPENIVLKLQVTSTCLEISADPGQVEQLLMNLCLNARDAMPEGGTLQVDVAAEPEHAVVTVTDSGTGITPEVRERMFEPFFTTKEVGAGSGLGLSIVHSIVNQLDGTIDVQSVPGKGSTFSVRLPLAKIRPARSQALVVPDV